MYASCVLISPAILRAMYVDELRTTDQIAAHFGCSGTTVRRHLRRFKIAVRPRGPCVERIRPRNDLAPRTWSVEVAYAVGLIATDGNLGRKKPVLTIVSKDTDLLRNSSPLPGAHDTDQKTHCRLRAPLPSPRLA